MKQFSWKPLLPHIIAVAIFLIVALIYCKPALEGQVLQQGDITQWKAMAKDIHDYKAKHGEASLWTDNMFSGMPGYMIATKANNVVPYYVQEVLSLFLPKPFKFFFLACVCFYIFCMVLRVKPWVAIVGALGYAYATYNPVIIAAGHDTKMLSIGLLPGLIAGLILIYERRYWLGAAFTAAFTGALISVNHLQITYYGLMIAFIMTIAYAVRWIMSKQWKHMMVAGAFAIVAGLVGVLSNAVTLFTSYEYSKETIRGGSQLADGKGNSTKEGLSDEYALSYSMYKMEPMVMMFPRMYGGSRFGVEMDEEKSKAIEKVQESPAPQLLQDLQRYRVYYWGGIGSTDGPPYVGAIICFLALIGFAILNNKHKWWILGAIVFSILISWGEYFAGFNKFLLDYLPMFNKFRAPSMIIVVPTFLLCMMAVMTLDKILFRQGATLLKFKNGLYVAGGVFVVAILAYFSLDYKGEIDKGLLTSAAQYPEQIQQGLKAFVSGLKEDRQHLFLMDILRSLFYAGVAALMIWLYIKRKVTSGMAVAVIGVMAFIDVMLVNSDYLNSEKYDEDIETNEAIFTMHAGDKEVLADQSYFRVFDLSNADPFNYGALTSYFHRSIGGYHPAKLSIYQDLINNQLTKYPNCQPVLDMLNTKYVLNGNRDPERGRTGIIIDTKRETALGAAWLVKGIRWVDGPKAEMDALNNFSPKDTAIIDKKYQAIANASFAADSSASIALIKADNDAISYKTSASSPQFAVFSEVYYDKGWNVYVDGKKSDYVKANYVLRAMPIPAGQHTIEFKFEPASHKIGTTVTLICSVLMLILLGIGFWKYYKKKELVVEEEI